MRKLILFLILLFLILDFSIAKEKENFLKLEYTFTHLGIPVGKLIVNMENLKADNYRIVVYTKAIGVFNLFKKSDYKIESYIEGNKPVKFHKQKKVGKKITDEFIYFYYPQNVAIWKYTNKPVKKIVFKENTQDLLSIFYYFKNIKLDTKNDFCFEILYNGVIWKVNGKVIGDESIYFRGKKINVLKIKFTSDLIKYIIREKDITIYFDKENCIPVLFLIDFKKLKFRGFIKNI
jgi:hypothetical protein